MIRRWLSELPIESRSRLREVEASVDDAGLVVVAIACGEAVHHAIVRDSDLVLIDHDIEAELAMVVFGAELPACLIYKAAWDGARTDTFLAEWAADGDGDRLDHARDDWYGNYWESWPSEPSAARALFGPRLQRELAIATARHWPFIGGRDGPGSLWGSVRHAVARRARRALVLSFASVDAHRRPDALVPMSITVVPTGTPQIAGVLSRRASYVELTLPVAWLGDVWARDLAVLDGDFVLRLEDHDAAVVVWRPTGAPHREHHPSVEHRRVERG